MTRKIFEITMRHIFVNNMSQVNEHDISYCESLVKISSLRIKLILHPFRNKSGVTHHFNFLHGHKWGKKLLRG